MRCTARSIATRRRGTAAAALSRRPRRSGARGSGGSRASSATRAGARSSSITGSARAAALLALVLVAGCSGGERAEERVDPRDYDAFFLWSGVRPPEGLARAERVYLL